MLRLKIKFTRKRIVIIVVAAVVVAIVAGAVLQRGRNKSKKSEDSIRTAKVRETEFTSTIDVTGHLEAADVQKVQFRGTGAITDVLVKVGDKVEKGQLLATIDDTSQRRSLLRAEQELEKQRATASEKELELLELDLQIAKNNMEYTKALANFAGEVTEVNIHVGDYTEAAKTLDLMQIVDKSYLKAYVEVDEMDVRNLHEGMEVYLNFDSLPNEPVRAVVHYIPFLGTYNSSSGIGIKKVELRIPDPPAGIFPGYSFSSTIESKSSTKYLLVQSSAIKSQRGKSYISKKNADGSISRIEVSVRYLGEGLSQVLSGDIKAGDEYVLNSSSSKGGFGVGTGSDMGGAPPEGGGRPPF